MANKLLTIIKPFLKPLLALGLVLALFLGHANSALAASGGRIGGGSFRAPARSFTAPSRSYTAPGGGYYGGGGFGFPFILPFFGFGGGFGGLFSILIVFAIANFLLNTFRNISEEKTIAEVTNPKVSVAKVQVGLLAQARDLQSDLEKLARRADTSTSAGLAEVLQETTLALLRHPEYWVYAGSESQQARLEAAESQFNRLALMERSKFSEETLSNFNSQLKQASSSQLAVAQKAGALASQQPGEYIVVTLLVAAQGQLDLPQVTSPDTLRQALQQIGAVSSDRLLALEVLWAPQAEGDVLTRDDMITMYPNLRLI
ncbi:DUF1517 domain-containing protein [Trichothermofontia sichuanensis B231]|uniref:DUF1517 domain-containing protein n=1 Tax=Trichothermofontia sichuanensis TaxID=3045816 RepID=UPI0022465EA2|nr:DUF1517 domain-containing protein [Trichothermofontia sichuanensis]UZQ53421.1 DUF1517 domain-containing protein [Trichothermofontia sichuanensis B231]